ncbi:uncharacterized protein LJ264_012969 isoform 1-T1 [Porphyrio hochstetteri]
MGWYPVCGVTRGWLFPKKDKQSGCINSHLCAVENSLLQPFCLCHAPSAPVPGCLHGERKEPCPSGSFPRAEMKCVLRAPASRGLAVFIISFSHTRSQPCCGKAPGF